MQVPERTRLFVSRPLAGFVLLASLSGCSFVEDRSERYVNAPEGQPLEVPAGLDGSRIDQSMAIRPISTDDSRRLYAGEIPTPPDMTSEILDENYVIEELDGRLWLLVNDVPGRLWPEVSTWMADSGLGIAEDSPQLGILQSELANFSRRSRELLNLENEPAAEEARVILQVRLAPGIRRKTTEIRVRRLALEEAPQGLLSWEDVPVQSEQDRDQQEALLSDIADFLKSREENKSFSRVASGIVSEPLVRLISENDEARAIRVELDYGRTWAEVSRSLEEIDARILDLNRSAGWLQVDFRSADERDPGWFSWFSDADQPVHTHTVNVTRDGNTMVVTAEGTGEFEGEYSAPELLTELFDHLY